MVLCRNLTNLHLQGQLPLDATVWGGLDTLEVIDVSGNNVTGYVPPQIMEVGALQNLSLANNGLQGPLPASVGASMVSMSTRSNQLTGGRCCLNLNEAGAWSRVRSLGVGLGGSIAPERKAGHECLPGAN